MDNNEDYSKYIDEPELDMTLANFLKYQKRYPVIAITWQPWIWKSTISKELTELLGAKLYTELPENNINLKIIKETRWKVNDITLWGNNQNYFLATDINQIIKAFIVSKKQPIVLDFALTQPFIFSDIKLKWTWLKVFKSMYNNQFKSLPKPDIVIELRANSTVLIDRLEKRWKHIDEFVIKMIEDIWKYYSSWIVKEHYKFWETKVIEVDNNINIWTEEIKKQVVNVILRQIKNIS